MGSLHSVSISLLGVCETFADPPSRLHLLSLLHYIEGKESPRPIDYEYGSAGPKETIDLEKRVGFVHSD